MNKKVVAMIAVLLVSCIAFSQQERKPTGPEYLKPASLAGTGHVVGSGDRQNMIVNGNFESGQGVGWTEYSQNGWDLVVDSTGMTWEPPPSGSWYTWGGGDTSEETELSQAVVFPSSGAADLSFQYYITSSDISGYDFGSIEIDGTEVASWDLAADATDAWVLHPGIDLSAYCDGASHTISFLTSNDSSSSSSMIIDDVVLDQGGSQQQDIPTLGEWGLGIFLVLLAGCAIFMMRRTR